MKRLLILAALAVMLGGEVKADFVVGWDFNGLSGYGSSPQAASTNDSGGLVLTPGWTRSTTLTTSGTAASNAWGANGWSQSTNLADATEAQSFVSVNFTSTTGNLMSFGGISAYNVRRSNSGPTTGQWQYQIGNNAFNNIGSQITWGGNSSSGNLQSSIDLSTITALQNVTSAVTFRIVNWGATTSGGTWYLNNRQVGGDIQFSVAVSAVPEPTTGLLLGIGTLACAAFRRNRRVA